MKFFKKIFLILIQFSLLLFLDVSHVFAAESSLDAESGCKVESASAQFADPHLQLIDMGPYVPCDEKNLGYRVRKTLFNLQRLKGMPLVNSRYSKNLIGSDPYTFLVERIHQIYILNKLEARCTPQIRAYVDFDKSQGAKPVPVMLVCPAAMSLSDLAFMEVLVHEARHADPISDFPHVKCERGRLSFFDLLACDESIEQRGSYAVGVEFNLAVASNSAVNKAWKMEARSSAVYRLTVNFNQLPEPLQVGAVLYAKDSRVLFYDGEKTSTILQQTPADATPTQVSDLIKLVSPVSSQIFKFDYLGGLHATDNRILKDLTIAQRKNFRDFIEFGDLECYLFTDRIFCISPVARAEPRVYQIPDGAVGERFMVLENQLVLAGTSSGQTAFIVTTDKRAYRLSPHFADYAKHLPATRITGAGPEHFFKTVREFILMPKASGFPFQGVSLRESDEVPTVITWDGEAGYAPGLEFLKIQHISGPFVWSPELDYL